MGVNTSAIGTLVLIVASVRSSSIAWGPCPAGQDGNECAGIPLPLDPDDAANEATVTAFVRRFYAGDAPTNKSLWMFAGGPGDSAESFAGGAGYFISYDPTVTVYLMDQRGVGMSLPTLAPLASRTLPDLLAPTKEDAEAILDERDDEQERAGSGERFLTAFFRQVRLHV